MTIMACCASHMAAPSHHLFSFFSTSLPFAFAICATLLGMSFATILKQADIFYELTPTQLEMVAALCQERRGKAGDIIFEENAASDELYIIAQGEIDIQVDPALVSGDDAKSPGP